MKNWIRFRSLRSEIMMYFVILIVTALAVITVFSMNYTEEEITENSKVYTERMVEMVNSELDSFIDYMRNIAEIVSNPDVANYLFGNGTINSNAYNRLVEKFALVLDTRDDIHNIAVIGKNGKFLCNRGESQLNIYSDYQNESWYRNAIETGGTPVVSGSHVQTIIKDDYSWVITLSMGIKNQNTGEIEGVFFIDLNYGEIQKLCQKTVSGGKSYLFIMDQNGEIIYHPKQQLLISGLQDEKINEILNCRDDSFVANSSGKNKLYTICKSDMTNWYIVGVSDVQEMFEKKAEMLKSYTLAAAVLFIIALILATFFSSKLTRPLQKLEKSMQEMQRGHFEHAGINVEGSNEISSLENSFNAMNQEIQHLMEENIKEQKEKRKSELMAMQSQINPHFLYNTLDSIIWMAEWGKNEEVVLMTSSLAKLLRQSIGNEEEIISIRKEIEYTRSYLTIQKMRYRDQLEFFIDVPEFIQEMKIIKLTVQPLVENAIYHGIKYCEEGGLITLCGYVEGDKVILSIHDNGPGIKKEILDHILENKLESEESTKRNRVGIYNVHNRLQLYYGKQYGLKYESEEGKGTTVKIILPYLLKRERQEEQKDEE